MTFTRHYPRVEYGRACSARDDIREDWRGREAEANDCEGTPGAAIGLVSTNEALINADAILVGCGYTRAEVDEAIRRICDTAAIAASLRQIAAPFSPEVAQQFMDVLAGREN